MLIHFHIEKVCDSWNNLLKKSSVWYKMNRKNGIL